jgi:hypothetical protein
MFSQILDPSHHGALQPHQSPLADRHRKAECVKLRAENDSSVSAEERTSPFLSEFVLCGHYHRSSSFRLSSYSLSFRGHGAAYARSQLARCPSLPSLNLESFPKAWCASSSTNRTSLDRRFSLVLPFPLRPQKGGAARARYDR